MENFFANINWLYWIIDWVTHKLPDKKIDVTENKWYILIKRGMIYELNNLDGKPWCSDPFNNQLKMREMEYLAQNYFIKR